MIPYKLNNFKQLINANCLHLHVDKDENSDNQPKAAMSVHALSYVFTLTLRENKRRTRQTMQEKQRFVYWT